jgi:hypothetical protein
MPLRVFLVLILSACSAKAPPSPRTHDATLFLSDAAAARLSAPELIKTYAKEADAAALATSSRQCPAQNARGDSVFTGLLNLAPSQERTRDYAMYWSGLLATCSDARIAAWYREAITHPRDDLTTELLTRALLRTRDPMSVTAVTHAAFDTANHPDARNVMLKLIVSELNYAGAQRLDLMIESYRRAGEVPGDFVVDQAAEVWLSQVPNWRESLLAQVAAAPGKRGAPLSCWPSRAKLAAPRQTHGGALRGKPHWLYSKRTPKRLPSSRR